MPDGRGKDAGERHWEHEFPSEVHHLIDPRAWQRAANPNEDEEQQTELREKPNVRWNHLERADRRVPAAEEESDREPADCEHAEIFGEEKRGVLEAGIFG